MDDEDNYVILVPVKKLFEMIENEWNRVYRIWHLFRVDFLVLKVWSKAQAKYAGFFSTFLHKNRKSCSKMVPKSDPFCVEFASRTLRISGPEKITEMDVTHFLKITKAPQRCHAPISMLAGLQETFKITKISGLTDTMISGPQPFSQSRTRLTTKQ